MKANFGEFELRTSRKLRACDWCIEKVQPGEVYRHWFGLTENTLDVIAFNLHIECDIAIDREADGGNVNEVGWGERHLRGMTTDETSTALADGYPLAQA
jgi:hypothetical protein